jgi:AcrR family transcriptional regulator
MARPSTITNEAILKAAMEMLIEHGIQTTTAQVAAHAGISEALVFHRFKRKEELFRLALQLPVDPPWTLQLASRVGKGEANEQLMEVCHQAIEFFRRIVPMAMLGWSHHGPHPDETQQKSDAPAIRGTRVLAGYFEAEMRLGRMRRHDAEVAARTLIGALWNYVAFEVMFDSQSRLPLPETTFVRSLTKLLFEGLAPPNPTSAAQPSEPQRPPTIKGRKPSR